MNKAEAKNLLGQIKKAQQSKTAFMQSSTPKTDALMRSEVNQDAMKTLAKTLLIAAGGGAALRGLSGIRNLLKSDAEPLPSRTVDMPVMYAKPQEKEAYSKRSVPYYIPGMMLGAPLAAYGGLKAIDAVLDKQRRHKSDDELDMAKKDYEQALLDSYKSGNDKSTDELLDTVFATYNKSANMRDWVDTAKGLGLTYALASAPLGYMVVNSAMKKNSKRRLLEKAMRERARLQAARQPAELYAIPQPIEVADEEAES